MKDTTRKKIKRVAMDVVKTVVISIPLGVVLIVGFTMLYIGVVISFADFLNQTGGYTPFAIAGVSAAVGGIVFAIAHSDEDLQDLKKEIVRSGELYALSAISFAAFGLFFPILDKLQTPYDVYYIPFIAVVISLVAGCLSIIGASILLVHVLWTKRNVLLRSVLPR